MATRSIVTSQPDVACDVCERRLLRGEQPDTFLAAGQPRIVCELCAPRAAHQGWKRGSDQHTLGPAPLRSGRGRSLLGRLRQSRRAEAESVRDEAGPLGLDAQPLEQEPHPYDFLEPAAAGGVANGTTQAQGHGGEGHGAGILARPPDGPLQRAVDVFNIGEYPRRVASLTRSLGAPEVSVRPGEAVASSIVIVLAWELCWYTYEVDLDDMQGPEARALAQGTELSELGPEDRLANALADERGALALL
ncbi:MAG TPA: hypothetical protein VHW67_01625 [Solirubrobacteraceae bacterium]|jgi:hypothetical protein|nr:hypothetical protein [Solirubrobacteraceae bacterium]